MGSYKGESSVFTGNPTGGSPGESNFQKTVSIPGGKMISPYTQDNVHGVSLKNTMGGKMGGSDSSLAHSLSGCSAVQDQYSRNGKNGKKEI
jgi:hypothetical protein